MRTLAALTILTMGIVLAVGDDARAQSYGPIYGPWAYQSAPNSYCLQGRIWGYPGNCQFSNYAQCMATASGTDAYCGIDPKMRSLVRGAAIIDGDTERQRSTSHLRSSRVSATTSREFQTASTATAAQGRLQNRAAVRSEKAHENRDWGLLIAANAAKRARTHGRGFR